MPADHFGERIAALYDAHSQNMFAPAAVDPVVDFLAGPALHQREHLPRPGLAEAGLAHVPPDAG
ncbi:MAG TPA: hypothetical protein VG123_40995 [Streptosporangiaceae bacterium]|nr:hypothetical protein [Streptosporangiaceae bacterium]